MPLFSVSEYTVRPEKFRDFEKLVASIADAARKDAKTGTWMTLTTAIGPARNVSIVMQSETFAERAKIEPGEQLLRRLLGEKKGVEALQAWYECVEDGNSRVLRDRPDLSYPAPPGKPCPFVMLTRIRSFLAGRRRSRSSCQTRGGDPKTDDPRRFMTLQPYFGDLREYVTAVGLDHPEQLDAMAAPAELLTRAFGMAEGGLISRAGMQAMAHATRELLMLRPDLSHND
jgi:hypothetical protein